MSIALKNLPIIRSQVTDDLLRNVLLADQTIYPVPLEFETAKSWVETNQLFSSSYSTVKSNEVEHQIDGVIIALPLDLDSWKELLTGKLKESNITSDHILSSFDLQHENQFGLHIFHIEKYNGWDTKRLGNFSEFAIQLIRDTSDETKWNLRGISGRFKMNKVSMILTIYKH
jgi:hypothetical protein